MLFHQVKHAFPFLGHHALMATIGERIRQRRNELGLSGPQLGAKCGVTKQAVYGWEKAGHTFTGPNLVKAAAALEVHEKWLATGVGPKELLKKSVQDKEDGRFVPVIDYVRAGNWSGINDPYPAGSGARRLLTTFPVSRGAFALTVEGDSMKPEFLERDDIIIDPAVTPRPGDYVVAKRDVDETATFKKFRSRGENEKGKPIIELLPLNSDYPPLYIDEKRPGRVVGVVVEHRRYLR